MLLQTRFCTGKIFGFANSIRQCIKGIKKGLLIGERLWTTPLPGAFAICPRKYLSLIVGD
jgi:hypothetical protein